MNHIEGCLLQQCTVGHIASLTPRHPCLKNWTDRCRGSQIVSCHGSLMSRDTVAVATAELYMAVLQEQHAAAAAAAPCDVWMLGGSKSDTICRVVPGHASKSHQLYVQQCVPQVVYHVAEGQTGSRHSIILGGLDLSLMSDWRIRLSTQIVTACLGA